MIERISPIRSELLAAKLEKLSNFELPELLDEFTSEPRLIQALWFLEYVSKPRNYPGGLTKFSEDFMVACAGQIGTPTMLSVGKVATYHLRDAVAILSELRECDREELLGRDAWIFENALITERDKSDHVTVERVISVYSSMFFDDEDRLETWSGSRKALQSDLLARLSPAAVKELCKTYVASNLANYLKEVCELPHLGFQPKDAPRYFEQVGQALLGYIEQRAESLRLTLAETEVTHLVMRWMKKAQAMGAPVMISGNSRFGKTEAVQLLCDMEPGRFRMVPTPDSNGLGDLLRAVARTLGIDVAAKNSVRDLRESIEYVLRHSGGIVLCFDEFQFCLPSNYSRTTAPARLNWVRRAVVDQRLPAVFICTPQSYESDKKRFVNKTGFAIQQFDERVLKTVHLPTELSEEDLLAVARIHFEGLSAEYLQLVVNSALATERNYVSDVSKIAKLAKDNARERGRATPILADIDEAIADVLPQRIDANPLTSRTPPVACRQRVRKSVAPPLQASRNTPATFPISSRGMEPFAVTS